MLVKLYYLYRKSLRWLRGLKTLGKMYEWSIPKLYKSYGTRWIAHKLQAMETVLQNYGVFMQHLESLAQTNSQALKRAELIGWAKWMDAKYPIDLAINLPCFDPFKSFKPRFPKRDTWPSISNSTYHQIQLVNGKMEDFDQSIAGWQFTMADTLQQIVKRYGIDRKWWQYVSRSSPNWFDQAKSYVKLSYDKIITCLALSMEQRFEALIDSPLFNSLASTLDVNLQPKNQAQLSTYRDLQIKSLRDDFKALLELNQCVISFL